MPRASRLITPEHPDGRPEPPARPAVGGALIGVTGLLLLGWLLSAIVHRGGAVLVSATAYAGFGSPTCACRPQHPPHPQMAFCASDFALKVRVLRRIGSTSTDKDEKYWVSVKNVFRNALGLTGVRPGRRLPLWVYSIDDSCGLVTVRQPGANIISRQLKERHSYLVTGKFERGKMLLSVCSWIAYWPSKRERPELLAAVEHQSSFVSKEQSRYLRRGHYAKGCTRCQIEDSSMSSSRNSNNNSTKSRLACRFDSVTDYNMCLAVHAFCGHYINKYRRHGECEWQTDSLKRYESCGRNNVLLEARRQGVD